ncbi:MAG: putative integral rane proteinlike [Myxococcaceae bacterium]|nr:putative integral rane proteinlike [Myxococcaceae bacterium]
MALSKIVDAVGNDGRWRAQSAPDGVSVRVLLFAWGGAKERNMLPLTEHYRSRGLPVTLHVTNVNDLMFRPATWRAKVSKLVSELRGSRRERLLFHVFSNTGFLSYVEFVAQSGRDGDRPLVRAALQVFESGPGIPLPLRMEDFADLWTRASLPILGLGNGDPKRNAYPARTALIRAAWQLYFGLASARVTDIAQAAQWFCTQPARAPYHFLYSKSDAVIPAECIEQTASMLRNAGADVSSKYWDNVSHASLFRRVPDEYFAHLEQICREPLAAAAAARKESDDRA